MKFFKRLSLERRKIRWSSLGRTTKMFFTSIFFIVFLSAVVTVFSLIVTEILKYL